MIHSKSILYKAFIISLIYALLLSSNCAVYRNMQPTVDSTLLRQEKVEERSMFRIVKLPDPEKTSLIVEFGGFPIYKEYRNVKEVGEKKNLKNLFIGGVLTICGLATMYIGDKNQKKGLAKGDTTTAGKGGLTAIGGVVLTIVGISNFINVARKNWEPAYKYTNKQKMIQAVEEFTPLAGEKIKAFANFPNKEWQLITDYNGRVAIDISEIAKITSLTELDSDLQITFKAPGYDNSTKTVTVSSTFFAELKSYYASIRPPELITSLNFVDNNSFKPDKIIDGAEKAFLIATIKNNGEGKALDVKLQIDNTNPGISISKNINIGNIDPGRKFEKRIPLNAAMNIADGKANITIKTKEKRGYDARPVKIIIPVRHLDKPQLTVTSYRLNDGKSGQANGDGDGIPENGETIELQTYVKNIGVGTSLGTKLELIAINQGLNALQRTVELGDISPNQTKQGDIVFTIPRAFTAQQLEFQLKVKDKIGASEFSKSYAEAFSRRAPVLAYDYRLLDNRGVEVQYVENGGSFNLEVTPKNNGSIDAKGLTVSVDANSEIYFPEKSRSIATLTAGNLGVPMRFNFSVPRSFQADEIRLDLGFSQNEFPGLSESLTLPVSLKHPALSERIFINTNNGDQVIEQDEYVDLTVTITNNGTLDAEDVKVRLNMSVTGIDFRDDEEKLLGTVPVGDMRQAKFSFYVMNSAEPGMLPISLIVNQADGFEGISKTLSYEIKEAGAIVVQVTGDQKATRRPGFVGTIAGKQPPVINIVNPPGNKVFKNPAILTIIINDDKPLPSKEPEIRVNGKLQSKGRRALVIREKEKIEDAGKKIQLMRTVYLEEGENIISASIYDSDNELGKDEIKLTLLIERVDIWAVVIGISQYKNAELNLKSADRDAQAFVNFLESPSGGSVPRNQIVLLLNEQATLKNVKSELNKTLTNACEDEMVILYFACHGIPEGDRLYFLAYDSDPSYLFSSALPQSDLEILLTRTVKTNKVIMFADACHSGALGMPSVRASRAAIANKLFSAIAQAKNGLAILAASSANEFSQEDQKWGGGHGVFTYYLLQGLKGKADEDSDGLVRTEELFQYVRREVSKETNGKQNPNIIDRGYDRKLPLGVVR